MHCMGVCGDLVNEGTAVPLLDRLLGLRGSRVSRAHL